MTLRISIRPTVYRGQEGYNVNAGRGRNIFCPTREQAEAYRELLRAGLPHEEEHRRSYEILCQWPGSQEVSS